MIDLRVTVLLVTLLLTGCGGVSMPCNREGSGGCLGPGAAIICSSGRWVEVKCPVGCTTLDENGFCCDGTNVRGLACPR